MVASSSSRRSGKLTYQAPACSTDLLIYQAPACSTDLLTIILLRRPQDVVFTPPTDHPKGVYEGDAVQSPIHAAAAADDVEALVRLLGPQQDYDPTTKYELYSLISP